jgi:MerR family transcriptional regulator, redox-sensitive transcriptional activator SoxR
VSSDHIGANCAGACVLAVDSGVEERRLGSIAHAAGIGPQVNLRSSAIANALLSVGELSRRSGVAVSALHFHETQGLIASTRTAGNQRRDKRDTLRRLAVIQVARPVGVPLRAIADALDALPSSRTPTRSNWKTLSSRWHADLTERISQLARLRDTLDGCSGCGCLSIDRCRLYKPQDIDGSKGPRPAAIACSRCARRMTVVVWRPRPRPRPRCGCVTARRAFTDSFPSSASTVPNFTGASARPDALLA